MDIQTHNEVVPFGQQPIIFTKASAPDAVKTLARPFMKWVGGKTQLLQHIDANMPDELKSGKSIYTEPFLGGGSVFFHVAQRYSVKRFVISDNNQDLIWAYRTVQQHVDLLVDILSDRQAHFWPLPTDKRSEMYYATREAFNALRHEQTTDVEFRVERTAQLIFLNKTCFNGLYRVNSSGAFNVAFGRYDKPPICDEPNLELCSTVLRQADIQLCDFEEVLDKTPSGSFIYLDPPYRPISVTSNFTSYSASTFNAADQERLAKCCLELDRQGCRLMISNSDPKNIDANDRYFENTFPDFRITTLSANRMVNCKADRRGKISELLITNY